MSILDKSLSLQARREAKFLVIEQERAQRLNIKSLLLALGFSSVSDAADYQTAEIKCQDQIFTHIIFDIEAKSGNPLAFLEIILGRNPDTICIPACFNPKADAVFQVILAGARGFLCKPITSEAVENSVALAGRLQKLLPEVSNASSRNEALAAMITTALDKAAASLKAARTDPTHVKIFSAHLDSLRHVIEISQTLAEGNQEELLEILNEYIIGNSLIAQHRTANPSDKKS